MRRRFALFTTFTAFAALGSIEPVAANSCSEFKAQCTAGCGRTNVAHPNCTSGSYGCDARFKECMQTGQWRVMSGRRAGQTTPADKR